jgi:DNA-binding NtrC family response regulator
MEGLGTETLNRIGELIERWKDAASDPVVDPAARRLSNGGTLKGQVDAFERAVVVDVLRAHEGNRTRAAAELGVTREGLYKIMKRHGIE